MQLKMSGEHQHLNLPVSGAVVYNSAGGRGKNTGISQVHLNQHRWCPHL